MSERKKGEKREKRETNDLADKEFKIIRKLSKFRESTEKQFNEFRKQMMTKNSLTQVKIVFFNEKNQILELKMQYHQQN
jgi:hypothetical protein